MKINIALACSRDWFDYATITATSILMKSKSEDEYCFYILSNGFDEKEKNKFLKLKKLRDVEFEFLTVEDSYFEGAIHDWLGVSASYRLRLQTLCKEDKVLYLDTDVVAAKDIAELYSIDVSDYYLAAVEDKCTEMMSQRVQKTFESKIFFNSGVQLINLKKIREDKIEEQMLETLRKKDGYTDQDVLNDICFGKILPLPLKYNIVQTNGKNYDSKKEEAMEAQKDPVLLHYWSKPWAIEIKISKYKLWNDAKDAYDNL